MRSPSSQIVLIRIVMPLRLLRSGGVDVRYF
jgi:hypothetical protein